jgi:rare lipoprotein A
MDRNKKNPVARSYSDSTYFRPTTENRQFVSKTNSVHDYPMLGHPDLDCGDIGATPRLQRAITCKLPKLFARRSTRRVSAALAGLLACATAAPVQANTLGEEAPQDWTAETGSASWYAASRHARRTASGVAYNQNALTAAHPWLPFGAKVRVTRRDTGHSIVVTITDRLPSRRHIIDLSVGAARELGILRQGTTVVELEPA